MDFLVGMVGDGFTLIASDCNQARSIVVMKKDMDKMMRLSEHVVMLQSGSVGDTVHFGEYIEKNLAFQELQNGYEASTWATANYIRKQLADYLRSRTPYQVNILLAGHDEEKGAQLYFMDHLASMVDVPFAAHGYGGYFTMSTMDRYYKPKMSLDEAKDVLRKVLNEVQHRFFVNMPKFSVRVVDSTGVRDISLDE